MAGQQADPLVEEVCVCMCVGGEGCLSRLGGGCSSFVPHCNPFFPAQVVTALRCAIKPLRRIMIYIRIIQQHYVLLPRCPPSVPAQTAQEVVVLCCAIKPLCAWNIQEVATTCRERCGGQGYLSCNRCASAVHFDLGWGG